MGDQVWYHGDKFAIVRERDGTHGPFKLWESLRRVAFWRVLLARNLRRKTICTPHRKSICRHFFFVKSQCELTDAMAMSLPSCENEMVRTGHSRYEKVLTQANSLTSHNETSASALPTAKYLPVGSNSIQMQFAGCACNTKNRKIVVLIKIL